MASALAITVGLTGYAFSYAIGFIGHTCSLIIFSSKSLRETSTGLFFIFLTISNVLYQLISIRDFIVLYLRIPTVPDANICRLRVFIQNFSTVTSAWLLVLITVDRLIRVRFPYQQTRICTQKMALYSTTIVCICSILFTCHVLQPSFAYTNVASNTCGPSRSPTTPYSYFYFEIWFLLQLIFTYFIPSILMIICVISIYCKIRLQRTLVVGVARRERIQRHMLILMLSSIACFIICTIPYSIHRIVYQRTGVTTDTINIIAILTLIFNLNYCMTFYIHCLTSKLFRQTFIEQIKRIFIPCKNQRQDITSTVHAVQTKRNRSVLPTAN